jgi:small subunit ribosomal protein S6
MPANVYECMFLLDPNKVAGDVPGAAKQLHALLERNHAEVLASRPWEERRLAYPIKNHKKGLYYLTYFRTEGKNVSNLEKDLSLATELVLRYLILQVDPKLVDIMLELARDEHRLTVLRTVNEPEGEGGAEGAPATAGAPAGEGGNGEPPRRGGPRGRPQRAAEDKDAP